MIQFFLYFDHFPYFSFNEVLISVECSYPHFPRAKCHNAPQFNAPRLIVLVFYQPVQINQSSERLVFSAVHIKSLLSWIKVALLEFKFQILEGSPHQGIQRKQLGYHGLVSSVITMDLKNFYFVMQHATGSSGIRLRTAFIEKIQRHPPALKLSVDFRSSWFTNSIW
jgi:hypothetical protein